MEADTLVTAVEHLWNNKQAQIAKSLKTGMNGIKSDVEFTRIGQSSEETDIVSAVEISNKKSKFFCGFVGNCVVIKIPHAGYKIVIGPHWPGVLVAEATIVGGSLLFLKLIDLNSSGHVNKYATLMKYNVMVMFTLTSLLLFAVGLMDPGIVMNDSGVSATDIDEPCINDVRTDDSLADDDVEAVASGISSDVRRDLRHKRAKLDSQKGGDSWCDICDVVQSKKKRVSHCYDCNVCIEDIDHHCPWMGKCIGRGNMNVFILFNMCWILFISELMFSVMFA